MLLLARLVARELASNGQDLPLFIHLFLSGGQGCLNLFATRKELLEVLDLSPSVCLLPQKSSSTSLESSFQGEGTGC